MNTITPGTEYSSGISDEVREHRTGFMLLGIVMIALGLAAIVFPFTATLAVELLIGWIFAISGVVGLVHSFRAPKWKGSLLSMLGALLAIAVGILLLVYPFAGMASLTLLITAFFFVSGFMRIALAFRLRPHDQWGWALFSGIIAVLLAVVILVQLPEAAIWVVGVLVGVDLIFSGWASIAMSMAARRNA